MKKLILALVIVLAPMAAMAGPSRILLANGSDKLLAANGTDHVLMAISTATQQHNLPQRFLFLLSMGMPLDAAMQIAFYEVTA